MKRHLLVLTSLLVLFMFSASIVFAGIAISPRTDLGQFTDEETREGETGEIGEGGLVDAHDTDLTLRWLRSYHSEGTTKEWLEKGHEFELTIDWLNKRHWLGLSQEWVEQDHEIDLSQQWRNRLHSVDMTRDWIEQDHDMALTERWGRAHKVHWTREGHDTSLSWQWIRDDHDETLSKKWDAENHHYPWSLEGHNTELSENWLDEHDKDLSRKWSHDGHWFVWTIEGHDTDLSWQWNKKRHRYGQSKLEQNKATELPEIIQGLNLPKGTENSLLAKVNNAIKSLENGKKETAANQLQAFIEEVKAQSSNKISVQDASILIEFAENIISHLSSKKEGDGHNRGLSHNQAFSK